MRKITNVRYKIIISLAVLLFMAVMYLTPIDCVILSLTGIRCLGCGMTRALISALTLDFSSAFKHNFMFWSVPLLYLCFWLDGKLFKRKIFNIMFYTLVALGFIANWIYRLAV